MSDLFWKGGITGVSKEARYEYLGFFRNPFPVDPCVKPLSGSDLENGRIYLESLRDTEQQQFDNLLIFKDLAQDAKKIALLMDYAAFRGRGIGKTAFLNHQLKRINIDFGRTISNNSESLCAVYVRPGGDKNERKFWQISRLIVESIYEQRLFHVALSRLRAFSNIIPDDALREVEISNISDTILNTSWLKHKNIDELKLNFQCRNMLRQAGVSDDLAKAITTTLPLGESVFFENFFAKKSDSFWRDNENRLLFDDVVKILKTAGFNSCVILFDESEKIVTAQNFQERRSLCDNLRHFFIDGASENVRSHFFRLLLTVHPYSQELLNPHWSASGLNRFVELGGDSAKHYTIFFQPLKVNSAIPLAALYLHNSRKNTGEIQLNPQDITPFQEDALQNILVKAEGIPGRYLQFLYLAIESAINNKWLSIGIKEIEQVIKTDITANQLENEVGKTDYGEITVNLEK